MKENVNGVDRYRMYIGGQWVDSSSNETIEVLNPTNEEVIATVPDASVEDGRRALEAARDAQPAWAALPAVKRGEHLLRFTAKLREHRERLARLLSLEQGKTYGLRPSSSATAATSLRASTSVFDPGRSSSSNASG